MQKRLKSQALEAHVATIQRIPDLPLELVTSIMEFLPQADRRRAASASRAFNAAAHVAGLELLRTIPYMSRGWQRALDTFVAVVDHFSGPVQVHHASGIVLRLSCEYGSSERGAHAAALSNILAAVTRSLPLLVGLEVNVHPHLFGDIYTALSFPAPRLRAFRLAQVFGTHYEFDNGSIPIPEDLFANSAPRLFDVALDGIALNLSGASLPAFARVQYLTLYCSCTPLITLSPSFPTLRTLVVGSRPIRSAFTPSLGVSGLPVKRLIIQGWCSDFVFVSPLLDVSTIDITHIEIIYHPTLWPAEEREFGAHIRHCGIPGTMDISVATIDTGRSWVKTFFWTGDAIGFNLLGIRAVDRLPRLHTQLTSLTIDELLLARLLRSPHTLAALTDLLVDCTRISDTPPVQRTAAYNDIEQMQDAACRIRCPALSKITFLSIRGTPRLTNSKVARLGRALRLDNETKPPPLLVLASVELTSPAIDGLLLKVYSSINELESTDEVLPGYHDYRTRDPTGVLHQRLWR